MAFTDLMVTQCVHISAKKDFVKNLLDFMMKQTAGGAVIPLQSELYTSDFWSYRLWMDQVNMNVNPASRTFYLLSKWKEKKKHTKQCQDESSTRRFVIDRWFYKKSGLSFF